MFLYRSDQLGNLIWNRNSNAVRNTQFDRVPCDDLIDEVIELVREDALFFDCVEEIEHARNILKNGTSAHWQLQRYQRAIDDGASQQEALKSVVDLLVEETMSGI